MECRVESPCFDRPSIPAGLEVPYRTPPECRFVRFPLDDRRRVGDVRQCRAGDNHRWRSVRHHEDDVLPHVGRHRIGLKTGLVESARGGWRDADVIGMREHPHPVVAGIIGAQVILRVEDAVGATALTPGVAVLFVLIARPQGHLADSHTVLVRRLPVHQNHRQDKVPRDGCGQRQSTLEVLQEEPGDGWPGHREAVLRRTRIELSAVCARVVGGHVDAVGPRRNTGHISAVLIGIDRRDYVVARCPSNLNPNIGDRCFIRQPHDPAEQRHGSQHEVPRGVGDHARRGVHGFVNCCPGRRGRRDSVGMGEEPHLEVAVGIGTQIVLPVGNVIPAISLSPRDAIGVVLIVGPQRDIAYRRPSLVDRLALHEHHRHGDILDERSRQRKRIFHVLHVEPWNRRLRHWVAVLDRTGVERITRRVCVVRGNVEAVGPRGGVDFVVADRICVERREDRSACPRSDLYPRIGNRCPIRQTDDPAEERDGGEYEITCRIGDDIRRWECALSQPAPGGRGRPEIVRVRKEPHLVIARGVGVQNVLAVEEAIRTVALAPGISVQFEILIAGPQRHITHCRAVIVRCFSLQRHHGEREIPRERRDEGEPVLQVFHVEPWNSRSRHGEAVLNRTRGERVPCRVGVVRGHVDTVRARGDTDGIGASRVRVDRCQDRRTRPRPDLDPCIRDWSPIRQAHCAAEKRGGGEDEVPVCVGGDTRRRVDRLADCGPGRWRCRHRVGVRKEPHLEVAESVGAKVILCIEDTVRPVAIVPAIAVDLVLAARRNRHVANSNAGLVRRLPLHQGKWHDEVQSDRIHQRQRILQVLHIEPRDGRHRQRESVFPRISVRGEEVARWGGVVRGNVDAVRSGRGTDRVATARIRVHRRENRRTRPRPKLNPRVGDRCPVR